MPSMSTAGLSVKAPENLSTNGKSEEADLSEYVDEMLHRDKRFVGMSRYVVHVSFFWNASIATACAGHGFIFFNPIWWNKLDREEQKAVIAHEIWHLMLNHLERLKDLDRTSGNIAADHVINLILEEEGFPMMKGRETGFGGEGCVIDTKYRGMSTEQVYKAIHQDREKGKGNHKIQPGTPSEDKIEELIKEVLAGSGQDMDQLAQKNDEIREDVIQQAQAKAGNQPGGALRLLITEGKKVVIQVASYQEIFEDYLTDPLTGGKRTFMRPSRRANPSGLRMKGRYPKQTRENRLTHLVYALDVSGSITQAQARQFLRSAATMKETLRPKLMTVMLWDTRIVFEKVFRDDEKLDNIRVNAGGGTNLNPVYERVRQLNPEALVIFTDLMVSIPPKPSWETIWFVPNKKLRTDHVTYGNIYLVPED